MDPKESNVDLFIEVGLIIKGRMQKAMPMPFAQCQALNFIADKERSSMQQLARYYRISPPSATLVVNELVRGGYVKRTPGKRDRRKVELTLTPKGERCAKTITERRAQILSSVFGTLSLGERKHLERILKTIISNA